MVYKNGGFVFGNYDIRLSRQVFHMQPVPESVFKQEPSHNHLGLGVRQLADPAHVVASYGGIRIFRIKELAE